MLNTSNSKNNISAYFIFIYYLTKSLCCFYKLLDCILPFKQMKIEKRYERSPAFLCQVNPVLNQQYNSSDMQNHFFTNKSTIQNTSKHLEFDLSDKQTPIIPPLQEEEYSNNVLNTGFIAQDSKFVLSDSQSVISDGFSISGVSAIRANPKASPHIIHSFDEEMSGFSGMDEWSQSSQISFTKRNFKRNKPQTIEDQCDQIQNQFTKKKMNDRNKVVTISQSTKGMKQSGYMLRSKSKNIVVQEESSSNEDIREILVNMEKQEKGANMAKNKINQKA